MKTKLPLITATFILLTITLKSQPLTEGYLKYQLLKDTSESETKVSRVLDSSSVSFAFKGSLFRTEVLLTHSKTASNKGSYGVIIADSAGYSKWVVHFSKGNCYSGPGDMISTRIFDSTDREAYNFRFVLTESGDTNNVNIIKKTKEERYISGYLAKHAIVISKEKKTQKLVTIRDIWYTEQLPYINTAHSDLVFVKGLNGVPLLFEMYLNDTDRFIFKLTSVGFGEKTIDPSLFRIEDTNCVKVKPKAKSQR